jgi:hypothetical protein
MGGKIPLCGQEVGLEETDDMCMYIYIYTLWFFNIAMGNGP